MSVPATPCTANCAALAAAACCRQPAPLPEFAATHLKRDIIGPRQKQRQADTQRTPDYDAPNPWHTRKRVSNARPGRVGLWGG